MAGKKNSTAGAGSEAKSKFVTALLENAFVEAPTPPDLSAQTSEMKIPEVSTITQQEVADKAGLSRPSVSLVYSELEGVLRDSSQDGKKDGRKVGLDPKLGVAFGVDIGQNHVRVAVANLHGVIIRPPKTKRPRPHDPRETLDLAAKAITELLDDLGKDLDDVVGVGISIAGPVDPVEGELRQEAGPINQAPSGPMGPKWQFIGDLRVELQEHLALAGGTEWNELSNTQFAIDNDANASALTEKAWGAARNKQHVIYLKWADGLGAGLILNKRLYQGIRGVAGEIGHTVIEPTSAERCDRCGQKGCLETVASRSAILKKAGYPADADPRQDAILEFMEKARDLDSTEYEVLNEAAENVGRVLGFYVTALNPEVVIVGGSVGARAFPLIHHHGLENGLYASTMGPALRDVYRGGIFGSEYFGETAVRGAIAEVLLTSLPGFLERKASGVKLGAASS